MPRRLLLTCSLLIAACTAGPQVHPELRDRADELLAVMREHARNYHTPPPMLYVSPNGWPVMLFGSVVAIDGPMIAVRMKEPAALPEDATEMIVPISGDDHQVGIRGDGVVATRLGDILICRFFASRFCAQSQPQIGDDAHLDQFTRPAR